MARWSELERKRISDLISQVRVVKTDRDLSWYRKNVIDKIVQHKDKYLAVEKSLGVPAAFTAIIHTRESAQDLGRFTSYIGNGQPLNKKTTIVPKNRGPFMSWVDGVLDAFTLKGYQKFKKEDWTLERVVYELERYNGFGYRTKDVNTPYVWNFTNLYSKGHFVADREFSATAVDKNIGGYVIYLLLEIADKDFSLNKEIKNDTPNTEKKENISMMDAIKRFFESILNALFSKIDVEIPSTVVNEPDVITRVPLIGDKGDHVKLLQKKLNDKGAQLKVDGDFGAKTQAAISVFQKANGLAGSGVLGPKTLEMLGIKHMPLVSISDDIRDKAWNIASNEIGVKEIAGSKHNPRILEYHKTTGGFSDDETAWCASFCNWVMRQIGADETRSAAARSFLNWGVKTTTPKKGDIVVFWRVSPKSWQGHVGFFDRMDAQNVWVLGGNQSNSVNISSYKRNTVLDFRTYK
jgi:uncharacterized protein (TIGR02594 family)